MRYSAQVWAEFRKFERAFDAVMDVRPYVRFFRERRRDGSRRKLPKRMKDTFVEPRNDAEREIASIIAEADAAEAQALEAELFQQKTRLTNAERALRSKPTRKAANDRRIAQARTPRCRAATRPREAAGAASDPGRPRAPVLRTPAGRSARPGTMSATSGRHPRPVWREWWPDCAVPGVARTVTMFSAPGTTRRSSGQADTA